METGTITSDLDPDTIALLRDAGNYMERQKELRERVDSTEAIAKLAAEQEALRAEIESCNRFYDENGSWSDGLRSW